MNDKIKKALGERADEFEALIKESGIELGIANDGSLVPANKFDTLKTDITKLQDQLKEKEKVASTVVNEKQTLEQQLEKVKTDMKLELDNFKNSVANKETERKRKDSLKTRLSNEKMQPSVLKYFLQAVDLESVQFDDEGKVSDEWVNALKEKEPETFGHEVIDSQVTKDNKSENKNKHYSSEDVDKMTQDEVNANYADIRASMREW